MRRIWAVVGVGLLLFGAACSDDETPPGADAAVKKKDGRMVQKEAGQPDKRLADRAVVKPDARQPFHKTLPGPQPSPWSHTATVLKDGKVLIAGGEYKPKGVEYLNQAHLYLPVQAKFSSAGSMTQQRSDHTATRLLDGRVLVVGGQSDSGRYTETAEIYDPSKPPGPAWTAAKPMFTKRVNHATTLLADGRVLVAGGFNNAGRHLSSLEIYDPKSGNWTAPMNPMKSKRVRLVMVQLQSGKVLMVGGFDGAGYPKTLELYDPKSGGISVLKDQLPQGRVGHTATLLRDGRVLIVGGYCGSGCTVTGDALYDPKAPKLTPINHAGNPPSYHTACQLKDGRVLIAGGGYSNQSKMVVFTTSAGGGWTAMGTLKQPRHGHTCSVMGDGTVLLVGGKEGSPGAWGQATDKAEWIGF